MVEKKETKKRESYIVEIGPLLKQILDAQKENIKKATFNCVNPSHYEAGEIIAKKVLGKGGIKNIISNTV